MVGVPKATALSGEEAGEMYLNMLQDTKRSGSAMGGGAMGGAGAGAIGGAIGSAMGSGGTSTQSQSPTGQ